MGRGPAQVANNTKRCSMPRVIRECESKQQWHTSTHLLEPQTSKTSKTRGTGAHVEGWELSFTAGGDAEWDSHFERQALPYRATHTLTIWSSHCSLWCWCKWVENLCSHRILHMVVYRSFIYNCPNLEATKMSFSRRMEKQIGTSIQWNIIQQYKEVISQATKDMEEP